MNITTSLYQVLNSAEKSDVHSQGDGVATTFLKAAWVKNLSTNAVKKVNLRNSNVPLIPGDTLGLAFINDDEIIAFKRTLEIPVEPAVPSKGPVSLTSVVFLALLWTVAWSFPILGYFGAIVYGLMAAALNVNIFGRFSSAPFSNRLVGLAAFAYGCIAFVHSGNMGDVFAFHIFIAIVFFVFMLVVHFTIYKRESALLKTAGIELETVWYASTK